MLPPKKRRRGPQSQEDIRRGVETSHELRDTIVEHDHELPIPNSSTDRGGSILPTEPSKSTLWLVETVHRANDDNLSTKLPQTRISFSPPITIPLPQTRQSEHIADVLRT
jgi:hypothetical protein